MVRIICLFTAILLLAGCSSEESYESIELFSLTNYLEEVKTNWSNKSIEKIYKTKNLPSEQDQMKHADLEDAFRLLNKYDINKPDYVDKYAVQENGATKVFKAVHDVPKVKEFVVYGKIKTDSIYLEYIQESIIGRSKHIIRASNDQVSISRSEKYMLSDSLNSQLIFRAR